jgi:RNA polymerase sigma factor (sigma-70 family)
MVVDVARRGRVLRPLAEIFKLRDALSSEGLDMSDANHQRFEDLMGRVRAGDRTAAGELWVQFEPEIRRTLRVRLWQSGLRGSEETDDRLQSVALLFFDRLGRGKLDERLEELQSPEALLNLFKKMAQGKYVDWIRHRSAQRRGERRKRALDGVGAEPADDETRASVELQHQELVEQGLALLNEEEQRIAEMLRTGHTWQQIADRLKISREAVRKQFYRAVKRLKQRLLGSASDDASPPGPRGG